MSVRAGREFLAIPGPTTVPDEVLRAMHRPAVDIYSGPLLALTDGLLRDIARVFNTKGRAYIYIANGHGAWEATLTNVLSKGDKILVLDPLHARARHLRGRLNAAVLRMSGITRFIATTIMGGAELKKATWPIAESDLVFAELKVPGVSDHHMQLAKLYRDTKRPELALVEVDHVLAMPFRSTMETAVHDEALKLQKKLR